MLAIPALAALAAAATVHEYSPSDSSGGLPELAEAAGGFPHALPAGRYVLVEFRREGCRMCTAFAPILAEVARQMAEDAALESHGGPSGQHPQYTHPPQPDAPDTAGDFVCVDGTCTPRPGVIPPDSDDERANKHSGTSPDAQPARFSAADWAARAPGRFRGASAAQFTCSPAENTCWDLGLRMLPTLRLYCGPDVVAERTGAAKLSVVLEWLADALEAHQDALSSAFA